MVFSMALPRQRRPYIKVAALLPISLTTIRRRIVQERLRRDTVPRRDGAARLHGLPGHGLRNAAVGRSSRVIVLRLTAAVDVKTAPHTA